MDIYATTSEAEETFNEFIQSLHSFNVNTYNAVPFPGSWTPGQLAQHVILSAEGFAALLNGPVEDTPRDPEQHIQLLRTLFLDFSNKMKSPAFVLPEEKEYDQQDHIRSLAEIKADLLRGLQTANMNLLCTGFELPNLGYLSGAEAVTFTIVHTQRHLQQLRNIFCFLDGPN